MCDTLEQSDGCVISKNKGMDVWYLRTKNGCVIEQTGCDIEQMWYLRTKGWMCDILEQGGGCVIS